MRNLTGYYDPRYPESLPADWEFPAPPVYSGHWTQKDWVRYAAPYNKSKWEGNHVDDS